MDVLPLLSGEYSLESYHSNPELWTPRALYLSLDKGFGAVNSNTLELCADQLEKSGSPHDLACAASAIIEATLFDPNRSPDTLDYDTYRIDYANHLMQLTVDGHRQRLEHGALHYDDQDDWFRAQANLAFGGVYRDMVSGVILPETRNDAFTQLTALGRAAVDHTKTGHPEYKKDAVGFAFEIAILLAGLTDDSSTITIPSTPRAGDGTHNPSLTNDFNYLIFDQSGKLHTSLPIELKSVKSEESWTTATERYDPKSVILLHTHMDLGLKFTDLPVLFGERSLNNNAADKFYELRYYLYDKVERTLRERTETDSASR